MPRTWKVLMVDGDESTHIATKVQFRRLKVSGKKIEIISAYSTKEAVGILRKDKGIQLMVVDMVMEDDNSGAKLIHMVRNELKNKKVRIIIRSGCMDLVDKFVESGFSKNYDLGPVCDKGDTAVNFPSIVSKQLKKYKVTTILKVLFIKMVIDLIKKLF